MVQGFKNFIMRGNVVELAVAVVIGSAFNAVVQSVLKSLIQPILAAIGGANVNGLAVQLRSGNDASIIDFASIINAIITFFITALVVYLIFVHPMNMIAERRKRGEEPAPEEVSLTTDQELLTEIRDLLRNGASVSDVTSRPTDVPPQDGPDGPRV